MKQGLWSVAAVCLALALTGCAKQDATTTIGADDLQQREAEISRLQEQVTDLERAKLDAEADARSKSDAMVKAEREAKEAKEMARQAADEARTAVNNSGSASGTANASNFGGSQLLPPNAKAGECYTRVHLPPTYKTLTERVMKRQASESVSIIPAKYEWAEERQLVREASSRLEVIPAKYDWVEERVLVKPNSTKLVEVPAEYGWEEEKILVKEAHTVWKKGRGPIERVSDSTGEIMCLVEVPAQYKTVKQRVLKKAAATREIEIPAEYNTVKKKVMTEGPKTREIEIPAEYKTLKVQRLVTAPKEVRKEIPAEYETVTRTELVTEGRMDWRSILCETNMNSTTVGDIQRALKTAGFDPGSVDGVYGRNTRDAVTRFQKSKKMATGGLTMATVKALGVNI